MNRKNRRTKLQDLAVEQSFQELGSPSNCPSKIQRYLRNQTARSKSVLIRGEKKESEDREREGDVNQRDSYKDGSGANDEGGRTRDS